MRRAALGLLSLVLAAASGAQPVHRSPHHPLQARVLLLPESFLAFGISPDGSSVLGGDADVGGAAIWRAGRILPLERDPADRLPLSFATASNARARVAVGLARDGGAVWRRGRRSLVVPEGYVRDVSANGRIAVGFDADPVLWRIGTRWVDGVPLPITAPGGFRALWADGISADGRAIAGVGLFDAAPPEGPYDRFLWRDGVAVPVEGLTGDFLDLNPDGIVPLLQMSADGTTLAGVDTMGEVEICRDTGICVMTTVTEAWRWRDGVVEGLGYVAPEDITSLALGISANGEVIVGLSSGYLRREQKAFLWDPTHGMRDLQALLASLGAEIPGRFLATAWAVSDDGRRIVGDACDEDLVCRSYLAVLPPACADHIDDDGDGRTDHPADPGCRSPFDRRE